jgi:hypothetical protein
MLIAVATWFSIASTYKLSKSLVHSLIELLLGPDGKHDTSLFISS